MLALCYQDSFAILLIDIVNFERKRVMKKICLVLSVLAFFCTVEAQAAGSSRRQQLANKRTLAKVCPKTLLVGGQSGTVYKNSAPLRSGGVGTPLIGYRKEPSLLMSRRYTTSGTSIYDSKGNKIGSCPWASAHGFSGGRFRCTMQTSSLRKSAVRNTNKANVYFKVNSKTCVEVTDAGRCYGSSKGLCNQLIK